MNPYAVKAPMLASLFGIADESGIPDDTSLVSINLRLDQRFTLGVTEERGLILLSKGELSKLVARPDVKLTEVKCDLPQIKPTVDGIPDSYVDAINTGVDQLVESVKGRAPWVLLHTPMLRYKQHGKTVRSELYVRIGIPLTGAKE